MQCFGGFPIEPAPNSSGPHAMSRAPWNCIAAQPADLHFPLVFQRFLAVAFAGQQDPRSAPGDAPGAEGFAVTQDLLETFDFTRFLKDSQSNLPAPAPLPQALLLHVARNYTHFHGFQQCARTLRGACDWLCSLQHSTWETLALVMS